jgi:hypothetical protein
MFDVYADGLSFLRELDSYLDSISAQRLSDCLPCDGRKESL